MQVDETANILQYLKNEFRVPYLYIPRGYFSNCSDSQRQKFMTHLGEKFYGTPSHCAISGFVANDIRLDPIFERYDDHVENIKSGDKPQNVNFATNQYFYENDDETTRLQKAAALEERHKQAKALNDTLDKEIRHKKICQQIEENKWKT